MDGPRDYQTKWTKSNGERQISYDITYIENLKKNKITSFEATWMKLKILQ